VVSSVTQVAAGDRLAVQVADGRLEPLRYEPNLRPDAGSQAESELSPQAQEGVRRGVHA
jgi:hypothetical protein